MFSENEAAIMIQDPLIHKQVLDLRKEFLSAEAPFMEIAEHDFLSLILLTPAIGVALANDSISLKEELVLNKKARKLSKGGYFMRKDPVIVAMQFLIKRFKEWEDRFLASLQHIMFRMFDKAALMRQERKVEDEETPFTLQVLNAPYIFIRFLVSFFLANEEDLLRPRKALSSEYHKICEVGTKLGISDIPLFQEFCRTYSTK